MSRAPYYSNLPHGVPEGMLKEPSIDWVNLQNPSIFKVTIDNYEVISTSSKKLDVLHIRSGQNEQVTMSFDEQEGWSFTHVNASGKGQRIDLTHGVPKEIAPFVEKAREAITMVRNTDRPGFPALQALCHNIGQARLVAVANKSPAHHSATNVSAAVYTRPPSLSSPLRL